MATQMVRQMAQPTAMSMVRQMVKPMAMSMACPMVKPTAALKANELALTLPKEVRVSEMTLLARRSFGRREHRCRSVPDKRRKLDLDHVAHSMRMGCPQNCSDGGYLDMMSFAISVTENRGQ